MKHSLLPTLVIAALSIQSLTSIPVAAQTTDPPGAHAIMMGQTHRQPAPDAAKNAEESFHLNGGSISSFPNPASARLVVTYVPAKDGDLLLRLLDRNGHLAAPEVHVMVTDGEERKFHFDVSGLDNGIYVLRAEQVSSTVFHRVVVAH